MSWHTGRMTAFDLETTGVDPDTARIVTATIVHIEGPHTESREWLVDPGVEIPAEAAAIHGVTTELAQSDGMRPGAAVAQIAEELIAAWMQGTPVVIFNASYDLTVLDRELRRHCDSNLDDVVGPTVDPFVIDKHLDPYRKGKRTLTACCEHYNVKLEDAHTSAGDAIAAARLAWRLAQVYETQIGDLATVNDLQATWRAAWAKSFAEYLAKQGKPEDVDGHWPIRPLSVSA